VYSFLGPILPVLLLLVAFAIGLGALLGGATSSKAVTIALAFLSGCAIGWLVLSS
jgi:fumarate reductase subunit D